MSEFLRLKQLGSYFQMLAADVSEAGGFTSVAQDPVEAMAKAVLSGVTSAGKMFINDVKKLAGYGAKATVNALEPVAAEAAAEGVKRLVGWAFGRKR